MRMSELSIWIAAIAIALIAPHASALPITVDRDPEIIDSPAFLLESNCKTSACVNSSALNALHPVAPGLTLPTQSAGLQSLGSPTLTTAQWPKSVSICYSRNTSEKCRKTIDTTVAAIPEPATVLLLGAGLLALGFRRLA